MRTTLVNGSDAVVKDVGQEKGDLPPHLEIFALLDAVKVLHTISAFKN